MPAPAEVSARPDAGATEPGPLRVRPPSPLPPRRRAAIAAVVVALVVVGMVLVQQARSADGPTIPGAAWRSLPVPRAAEVDAFDRPGALGDVEGFGAWRVEGGAIDVTGGIARSGDGAAVATVDAGSADVLVHAQVVRMGPGSGLLLSSSAIGVPALALRATGPSAWELVWERSGPAPEVLQAFAEPTEGVSVQLIRRGDRIKVLFDDAGYDVDAPAGASGGTFVGVSAAGPGTELDLFGYLPLDPG
jgi:hypothetical protein